MDPEYNAPQLHGELIDCRHCNGSTFCQNAQRMTTNKQVDASKRPGEYQFYEESAWFQCDRCGQGTLMRQVRETSHTSNPHAGVNEVWAPYPTCRVCNGTGVVRV